MLGVAGRWRRNGQWLSVGKLSVPPVLDGPLPGSVIRGLTPPHRVSGRYAPEAAWKPVGRPAAS